MQRVADFTICRAIDSLMAIKCKKTSRFASARNPGFTAAHKAWNGKTILGDNGPNRDIFRMAATRYGAERKGT